MVHLLQDLLERPNKLSSRLSQPMTLYMLTKSGITLQEGVSHGLVEELGEALTKALLSEENRSDQRFAAIAEIGPPVYSEDSADLILKQTKERSEAEQEILAQIWVQDVTAADSRRGMRGIEGLKQLFSLIMMNDDKEISSKKDHDLWQVQEMLSQKSPYLVLIPAGQANVMASASTLYRTVCFLKDQCKLWNSLALGKTPHLPQHRLSHVHPLAQAPTASTLPQLLNLLCLYQEYGAEENASQSLPLKAIASILHDETRSNLRDLPAYYFSASKMLRLLKKALEFDHAHGDTLWRHVKGQFLNGDAQEMAPELEQLKAQSAVGQSLEGETMEILDVMMRTMSRIRSSTVIEVIESMLILPLEHRRMALQSKFMRDYAYLGRFGFLYYHIRSYSCLAELEPTKAEQQEQEARLEHLSMLLPSKSSQPSSSGPDLGHSRLHSLLQIISGLHRTCLEELWTDLGSLDQVDRAPQALQKIQVILQQLLKIVMHSDLYLRFANIVDDFLAAVFGLVVSTKRYLRLRLKSYQAAMQRVTEARPRSYQVESIRQSKEFANEKTKSEDAIVMYEN